MRALAIATAMILASCGYASSIAVGPSGTVWIVVAIPGGSEVYACREVAGSLNCGRVEVRGVR